MNRSTLACGITPGIFPRTPVSGMEGMGREWKGAAGGRSDLLAWLMKSFMRGSLRGLSAHE